jgi:ribosome-associated protein
MAATIEITPEISLAESELQFRFIRASGPGGQNVNALATAVQLRFDVASSPSLPDALRARLTALAGRRLSDDGILVIEAKRFRSQAINRRDAVERLVALIRRAAQPPKPRRKTRPSRAAKERRLTTKRQRSETKRRRQTTEND